MNENHSALCPSPEWAEHIQTEVLPRLTAGVDLGERMLEVGPGPGAATEWLRQRVALLVAVELDDEAAKRLAARFAGGNVEVVVSDACEMNFPDSSFDSAGTFTMLHHVPTTASQDRVLSEVFRVLRLGGVLVGSDSLASNELHHFHAGDTYNPIDPATLIGRLRTIGYDRITVAVDRDLQFIAYKPVPAANREDGE